MLTIYAEGLVCVENKLVLHKMYVHVWSVDADSAFIIYGCQPGSPGQGSPGQGIRGRYTKKARCLK